LEGRRRGNELCRLGWSHITVDDKTKDKFKKRKKGKEKVKEKELTLGLRECRVSQQKC